MRPRARRWNQVSVQLRIADKLDQLSREAELSLDMLFNQKLRRKRGSVSEHFLLEFASLPPATDCRYSNQPAHADGFTGFWSHSHSRLNRCTD
jgi:hypothetical protein